MKVLVVEDVTDSIEAALIFMERYASVVPETSFANAKKTLAKERFDLLVLDVRLVDIDHTVHERGGVDLIKFVKSEKSSANYTTPFVMLTGQKASLDLSELKELSGFRGVFQKIRHTAFTKFFETFLGTLK